MSKAKVGYAAIASPLLWAPLVIVSLRYSGYLSKLPPFKFLPTNLTVVVLAGCVAILSVIFLAHFGLPASRGLFAILVLVAAFVPGSLTPYRSAYGSDKVWSFIGVTLVATVGVAMIVRNQRYLSVFLQGLFWASAALALLSPFYTDEGEAAYGRLSFAGNTIALGHLAATAIILMFAAACYGRVRWSIVAPASLLLVVLALASGSRGPMLALPIALLTIIIARPSRLQWKAAGLIVVSGLGFIGALIATYVAPTASLARFTLLVSTDKGDSIDVREDLWEGALALIPGEPGGYGWGNSAVALGGPVSDSDVIRFHPHNIFLESALEGGWIAGLVIAGFIVAATVAAWSCRRTVEATALLALLIFSAASAWVSGDINDNRGIFIIGTLAIMCPVILRVRSDGPHEPHLANPQHPLGLSSSHPVG